MATGRTADERFRAEEQRISELWLTEWRSDYWYDWQYWLAHERIYGAEDLPGG